MTIQNNPKYRVLLVDDEKEQLDKIKAIIEKSNSLKEFIESIDIFLVTPQKGTEEIANQIKENPAKWNIILSDLFMPTAEGKGPLGGLLIAKALQPYPKLPVKLIFISNKEAAGGELREYIPRHNKWIDWYPKPKITPDDSKRDYLAPRGLWSYAIAKAIRKLNQDTCKEGDCTINDLEEGLSGKMRIAKTWADKFAANENNVLILGESGTGKEIFARYIHNNSSKKEERFEAINCASLPEEILESELFGHERGAFTGAIEKKDGLFKLANKGTLFLDEIGKAKSLYSKLLRVVDPNSREFKPVGSNTIEKFTGRIICATSEPLDKMVEASPPEFSKELFARITEGGIIKLTPLRERKEDIVPLAEHLIKKVFSKHGIVGKNLSQEAKQLLEKYEWPENVRELENKIKRALSLSDNNELSPDDFDEIMRKVASDSNEFTSGLHEKNLAQLPPEIFVTKIKGMRITTLMRITGLDKDSLKEIVKTGLKIKYEKAGYNVAELAKTLDHPRTYIYGQLPDRWGFTDEEIEEIFKTPHSTPLL